MAGMMAETYMLQALSNGINQVRSNTSLLTDILDALNPNELNAAKTYFGDATKTITIAPGFPSSTNVLPFIGVTVANDATIPSQMGIGNAYYRVENADNTFSDRMGARFSGNIKGTIYTPNADLIVWLSAVCKWSLLTNIGWFDDTAGLNNVQISLGDYEPSPDFLPVFTFARGVFLSGEYDSTFTVTPSGATSATINPGFQPLT